ncbi:MAG TPA: SDR family NAD(P)-dependent oxidoreductase, partial [Polyangiaceae bacterium]|nr:SDR family NAD(P)-dependent oxidoreductase [Polyangiaceae bacterium]
MTAPQRWVLVTGAASGIGEATARAFAAQGDRLVLVDRDEARLHEVAESLRGAGTEVEAHCVDVSDRAAVEGLADALHQRIEALDVLVNNAGVLAVGGYEETSYDDFDRVFAVNVRGVVHGMKAFAPAMRRRRRGAIAVLVAIA